MLNNCANSGAFLKKWRYSHVCSPDSGQCSCTPPFELFPFPTVLKSPERRQQWIKALNRTEPSRKLWEPNSRVCSEHFTDGQSTDSNPCPSLKLGYKSFSETKATRKLPAARVSTETIGPVKKRKLTTPPTEPAEFWSTQGGSSSEATMGIPLDQERG